MMRPIAYENTIQYNTLNLAATETCCVPAAIPATQHPVPNMLRANPLKHHRKSTIRQIFPQTKQKPNDSAHLESCWAQDRCQTLGGVKLADNYSMSFAQYLQSRNRTFQQNEMNFPSSSKWSLCENAANHFLGAATQTNAISCTWPNVNGGALMTLVLQDGFYDAAGVSRAFASFLQSKGLDSSKLQIVFDNYMGTISLQSQMAVTPNSFPQFYFPTQNGMGVDLGFTNGVFYPPQVVNTGQVMYNCGSKNLSPIFTCRTYSNTSTNQIRAAKVVYKPSNPEFASQGGVDSSARTSRQHMQMVQKAAATLKPVFGSSVANAESYVNTINTGPIHTAKSIYTPP